MAEENNNAAIVKIVEDGPSFTTKVEELKINGIPVECSILGEEEISKPQLDKASSSASLRRFQLRQRSRRKSPRPASSLLRNGKNMAHAASP